jgi:hypothetical protein
MAVLPVLALMGCATASSSSSSSLVRGMTAPNPNGCYIQVFDSEQLRGRAEFINGPMRYGTLAHLPNGADWSGRIRSVEVGPAASVTIWTSANRGGKSMDLHLDHPYPVLPDDFSGKVQSIDLRCAPTEVAGDAEAPSVAAAK